MLKYIFAVLSAMIPVGVSAQQVSHLYSFNDVNTSIHKDGDVWVGTSVGLLQRNAHTYGIKNYYNEANSALVSNYITSLAVKQDELWIGTTRGISVFDGKSFRTIPGPEPFDVSGIMGIAHTQQGKTFALTNKGLWEVVGETFHKILLTNTVDQLKALGLANVRGFWTLGFSNNCYPVLQSIKDQFSLPDSLEPYCPVFFSSQGEFFTGSRNGILSYRNGTWKRHSLLKRDGGVPDFIREDKRGRIWFDADNDVGIYENGNVRWLKNELSKSVQEDFTWAIHTQGLLHKNMYHDIAFNQKNTPWLIMSNGLLNCDEKLFYPFPNGRLEIGDRMNAHWLGDTLVIVTRFQYVKFVNGSFTLIDADAKTNLSLAKVSHIEADANGSIWVSGQIITRLKSKDTLDLNLSPAIHGKWLQQDKFGTVWLSTSGQGLIAIDTSGGQKNISYKELGLEADPEIIDHDTATLVVCLDRLVVADEKQHRTLMFGTRVQHFSSAIYDSQTKGIWIAGDSLFYFDGKKLVRKSEIALARKEKFNKNLPMMFQFDNEIWAFSSRNTMIKCTTTKVEEFGPAEGIGPGRIYWYSLFRNQLVLRHKDGLSIYKDKRWRYHPMPAGYDTNEFSRAIVDAHGVLWFPSKFGKPSLLKFDGVSWRQISLALPGVPAQSFIYHLHEDRGLIVAVTSAGLFFISPDGKVARDSNQGDGLKIPIVVNGVVVALQNERIVIYKDKIWRELDVTNGLFGSTVFAIKSIGYNKVAVHHPGAFTILEF